MPVPAMPGGSVGGGGAAQAVTRYHALFESVRSRRRKPETFKGLDAIASQGLVRLKNRKVTLRWLRAHAEQAERIGAGLKNHSDAALNEVVRELREVFRRGRQDEQAVQRALAAVREVGRRETGEEAFTVQLMGALALYHGRVVEMLTGEGKTLTGSLVAPLLAWRHRYLHVFTVNDYLAARDAASRRGIYRRCGCDVGAITQQLEPGERWGVYAKPIVYGTPKQITADYLRDQLRLGEMRTPWAGRRLLAMRAGMGASAGGAGPMIPGLRACLVDEADAVLIDEGVVPLIIARARREDEMSGVYKEGALIAAKLDEGADYTMDQLKRRAELTRRGRHRALGMCSELSDAIWRAERRAEELIKQALVARHCYLRGQQYEIVDGRVVIVDEYTGRFLADRSWEHGLHQAVEAKEGVEVTADRETLARISFQRFFRMYPLLCGMTGTAADARGEIERVYARPVTIVPTNRPLIRQKWPMRIFRTAEAKWTAIVGSIQALHEQGRPVLVGTRSIETSELLSAKLEARGLTHRVLNANFDKDEAEMIVGAGKGGRDARITVATNMAGRGTDIKLDREAEEAGGLHVILTEMHTALRIDRQFIGRAGRQGDPGSSQLFVSLEDEIARLYVPKMAAGLRAGLGGAAEGKEQELSGAALRQGTWMFRLAQRRAEARGRRSRGEVLRQDDWIDKYLPGR